MNILLALAWATAILGIILATASVIATSRARKRWNTATRAAEDALERADRARRHHDIAREDLKAQRKLLEAQTPSTVTFESGAVNVKPAGNPRQVAEQIVRRTRKLGQNRPTQTSQSRDDAADALGHSLMGMVIADAVVHNNAPEHVTVTGTPTYTPTFTPTYTAPDPSPSSSYDSGSSSSSSSYDSGSSSSYDSGSNSSGGGDF